MNHKEKIVKNTFINLFTPFLPLLVGFILMPFIIYHIGSDAFGFWALCFSIVGYAGLLDLGFSQTVIKKVSEYSAVGNNEKLQIISSKILSLYTLFGCIVFFSFILIGTFTLNSWFNIPFELQREIKIAFYIIGVQAGLSFLTRFWDGFVCGMQKFIFRTKVLYVTTILQFFLIIVFLSLGYGLIMLASISLFLEIFKLLSYYRLVSKNTCIDMKLSFKYLKYNEIKNLFSFSLQFFILQACFTLIWQTDRIVIGIFLPIALLTLYEIGLRINEAIRSFVASVQYIIMPAASELHAIGKKEFIDQIIYRGSKYVFILFLLLTVPVAILSDQIIEVWVGENFVYASKILIVLLIGQMFNVFNFATVQVFQGIGKLRPLVTARIISSILNLVLSIIFLKLWGLIGVALGTAVQFLITDIPLLIYLLKKLNLSRKRFLQECVLSTFPIAILSGIPVILLLNANFIKNSLIIIIVGLLMYISFYLILLLNLTLNKKETKEIINIVSDMLPLKLSLILNRAIDIFTIR